MNILFSVKLLCVLQELANSGFVKCTSVHALRSKGRQTALNVFNYVKNKNPVKM